MSSAAVSSSLIRVQRVFREVLEDDSLKLKLDDSPKQLAAWDSFAHVKLVIGLEEEFNIKLRIEEAERIKDIAAILELVERKLAVA